VPDVEYITDQPEYNKDTEHGEELSVLRNPGRACEEYEEKTLRENTEPFNISSLA
jgi:hypothetical protein